VARGVTEGKTDKAVVTRTKIREFLGPERFFSEIAERVHDPGVATGLAWTPNGGEILFIESTRMNGKKGLTLTGHLGEVMKESAQAALSYVRARADKLGIETDFFENADIHLHVPAGAIPKDGPSAGVAMAVSLISLLTGRVVRHDVAMTGEITLRGRALPVGGVKEKVLAAKRAGIRTVILPKRNEKDLEELTEQVRREMSFVFVETVDEALPHALQPLSVEAGAKPPERKRAAASS
jgi:ATP-dependent Lon protease